jgi:hypothetical protein
LEFGALYLAFVGLFHQKMWMIHEKQIHEKQATSKNNNYLIFFNPQWHHSMAHPLCNSYATMTVQKDGAVWFKKRRGANNDNGWTAIIFCLDELLNIKMSTPAPLPTQTTPSPLAPRTATTMASSSVTTTSASSVVDIEKTRTKRERQLKSLNEKENEFNWVVEANKYFLKSQVGQNQAMTTRTNQKFAITVDDDQKPGLLLGGYVFVSADTSPGMNRTEGFGFVKSVHSVGAATIASVKYDLAFGRQLHSEIPFKFITVAVFGQDWQCSDLESSIFRISKQRRPVTTVPVTPSPNKKWKQEPAKKEPPAAKLVTRLRTSNSNNKGKGWHRIELNLLDPMKKTAAGKLPKLPRLNAIEKMQLLMEVVLLEQYLADPKNSNQHNAKYKRSQKFKPGKRNWNPIPDTVVLRYLVEQAWGCSNSYLYEQRGSQKKFATATAKTDEAADLLFAAPPSMDSEEASAKSVIDDYEMAETKYYTAYLYAVNECRRKAKDNLDVVDRESYTKRFSDAKKSFETLDNNTKEVWESKRRSHLLRQPRIREEIISALKKNPKSSWRHIGKEINHWCCDSTIQEWVTSNEGFKVYAERIIPLLSDAQRKKHLDFGKHFRFNWGLGGGKYLPVHYDEKWFWGLVVRRDVKCCEELGIDPQ